MLRPCFELFRYAKFAEKVLFKSNPALKWSTVIFRDLPYLCFFNVHSERLNFDYSRTRVWRHWTRVEAKNRLILPWEPGNVEPKWEWLNKWTLWFPKMFIMCKKSVFFTNSANQSHWFNYMMNQVFLKICFFPNLEWLSLMLNHRRKLRLMLLVNQVDAKSSEHRAENKRVVSLESLERSPALKKGWLRSPGMSWKPRVRNWSISKVGWSTVGMNSA